MHTSGFGNSGRSALVACSLLFVVLGFGCGPKKQQVSVDAGNGMRKGSPPMCYQYRGESRPLAEGYDIWLHVNNTCSYAVDCTIYDDVSERSNRYVAPPHQSQSIVLVRGSQAKRVDLEVECIWKS